MGSQTPKLRYLDRNLSKARNVYFTLLVEDEKSDGANISTDTVQEYATAEGLFHFLSRIIIIIRR